MAIKMKIRKGDEVIVIAGKKSGNKNEPLKGEVIKVFPDQNRVIVRGVNVVKKHTKPTQANPNGGVVEKELPIHASNVSLIDPKDGKPTRVGYKILGDGKKVRIARRSGEQIDIK